MQGFHGRSADKAPDGDPGSRQHRRSEQGGHAHHRPIAVVVRDDARLIFPCPGAEVAIAVTVSLLLLLLPASTDVVMYSWLGTPLVQRLVGPHYRMD